MCITSVILLCVCPICAAKVWGKPNNRPILALHGWQDNAGTFDKLIPMLSPNFYIVCLDFVGKSIKVKPVSSNLRENNVSFIPCRSWTVFTLSCWSDVSLLGSHQSCSSCGSSFWMDKVLHLGSQYGRYCWKHFHIRHP